MLFSSSVMTFSVIEEENKWFLKALHVSVDRQRDSLAPSCGQLNAFLFILKC